jgi:hypothetical protein
VQARRLVAEPPHQVGAVESEIFGRAAHEAERIGPARQVLEPALLDRVEIDRANTQLRGHRHEILPVPFAGAAQQPADLFRARLGDGRPRRLRLEPRLTCVRVGRLPYPLRHLEHPSF